MAKVKGLISSREQQKQFDQAVKDVIKQRRAVNQLQQQKQQQQQQQQSQNGRSTHGPGSTSGGRRGLDGSQHNNQRLRGIIHNNRDQFAAAARGGQSLMNVARVESAAASQQQQQQQQQGRQRQSRRRSHNNHNSNNSLSSSITAGINALARLNLQQEAPVNHPRHCSMTMGAAVGAATAAATAAAPSRGLKMGGSGGRGGNNSRRITISDHGIRRPAVAHENRRQSDGDTTRIDSFPSVVSGGGGGSQIRTTSVEEGDIQMPSQRRNLRHKQRSFNRSASFKSSLNGSQLENILSSSSGDDDDDEPQAPSSSARMARATSAGSLAMSGLGRGARKSDLTKILFSNEDGTENAESYGDTLLVPTYRPVGNNNKPGEEGANHDDDDGCFEGIEAVRSSGGSSDELAIGELGKALSPSAPATSVVNGSEGGQRSPKPGLEMEFGSRQGTQRAMTIEGKQLVYQRNSASMHSSGSAILDKDHANGLGLIKEHDARRGSAETRGSNKSNDDWAWLDEAPSFKDAKKYSMAVETKMKQKAEINRLEQRQLAGDSRDVVANGLGKIKLEDLIPTKRTISGESSVGSPSSPSKDMAGQWKKQELRMMPPQVDFNLGLSESDRGSNNGEIGTEAFFDAMPDVKSSFKANDMAFFDAKEAMTKSMLIPMATSTSSEGRKLTPGSRTVSSSDLSYATAKEDFEVTDDATSSMPTLPEDVGDHAAGDDVCPRSQFVLLKSQQKSQSGATGPTQGTSASSLVSDLSNVNSAADAPLGNNKSSPTPETNRANNRKFDAIKEESKDIGDTDRERHSGDTFEMHAKAENRGSITYKDHKSSKMKKIRKGIRKTLMGSKSKSTHARNEQSEYGEMSSQMSSQGGSTMSAEQKDRLTRHLSRKSSSRSITSAVSSFSAITGKSDATSSSKGGRWRRFGLKGRAQSMYNMKDSPGMRHSSHTRPKLVTGNGSHRDSTSNVSNLSSRSDASFGSQSSSYRARFTDFYDHNDHARAVSTLISAKSTSGRSLVTSLDTVRESRTWEGETKQDEDYHHAQQLNNTSPTSSLNNSSSMRDGLNKELSAYRSYMENSNRSDDSVNSYYRHPSHEHLLVHMRPNQLFPDSPGWQCDECCQETFDLNVWAYISSEKNYLVCERCFAQSGFSVDA